MKRYKVSELDGALLDAAVAEAEGLRWRVLEEADSPIGRRLTVAWPADHQMTMSSAEEYEPSTDWAAGGPIIERERIELCHKWQDDEPPSVWIARCHGNFSLRRVSKKGRTPLVAAMRAYVAAKLGEEVELP